VAHKNHFFFSFFFKKKFFRVFLSYNILKAFLLFCGIKEVYRKFLLVREMVGGDIDAIFS
jgi:hypothetical protein